MVIHELNLDYLTWMDSRAMRTPLLPASMYRMGRRLVVRTDLDEQFRLLEPDRLLVHPQPRPT
jgi:hypothetical protein